jgi:uncharacterized repeat protein (TIGR01451 family)
VNRPRSRVLAGVASLAIGGMFVAASALGAMADSPAPTNISATVAGNTVTLQGQLEWGGKCQANKGAGFGIIWNDSGDLGAPTPGAPATLVGLTGAPHGDSDNNLVHAATCSGNSINWGPISHTYIGGLPPKVCAIGYHFTAGQTNSPFHSIYEGNINGQLGNTDNSILEPTKGGQNMVCTDVVKKLSDVALTETGTPGSVVPGNTITYTVPVGNNGSKAATSTTQTQHLNFTIDDNTTLVSFDKGGWTNCFSTDPHIIRCDYTPTLGINDSVLPAFTAIVKVLDNGETSVTSTAHVDNGDNSDDADTTNQSAQVRTPVQPQGISIDKTATPQVKVGDPITYTMKVTNNGTMTTSGTITVTDTFPAGVTPDPNGASGTNWSCVGVASITCTWNGGDLAPGQSTTLITDTATALDSAVPHVSNTAFAHLGNITVQDTATTIVNTDVNLTLHKSADPVTGSDVNLGDEIEYTLHYANTGSTDAKGVTITDTIPNGTTYTNGTATCSTTCTPSFANNTLTFALDIPANSAGDAFFEVTVNKDDVDGQIINNQGHLHFGTTDVPSNITHHRVHVPSGALNLVKSVSYASPASVGSVLTYKLVASATGNMDQTGVVVTDVVPDGTSYVGGSATCSAASCNAGLVGNTVTWSWPTLSPGHPQTLTFKVTVNGPDANGTIPTEIINVGSIKSNETPDTPSNRVIVPLTQVLGTKIVKPTTLPFTGLNSLQDALLAAVLIGGGMMILTWPRLQSQSRRAV